MDGVLTMENKWKDMLEKVPIYITKRTMQHLDDIHGAIFADEEIKLEDHGDFIYVLCCHFKTRLGIHNPKKKKKKQ